MRSVDVVVVRPESELFYANADNVHAAISSHITDRTRAVVLDLESVPAIDFTATEMLRTLDDELTSSGVRLVIAREAGQVGDLLRQAGAGHLVVRDGVGAGFIGGRRQPTSVGRLVVAKRTLGMPLYVARQEESHGR